MRVSALCFYNPFVSQFFNRTRMLRVLSVSVAQLPLSATPPCVQVSIFCLLQCYRCVERKIKLRNVVFYRSRKDVHRVRGGVKKSYRGNIPVTAKECASPQPTAITRFPFKDDTMTGSVWSEPSVTWPNCPYFPLPKLYTLNRNQLSTNIHQRALCAIITLSIRQMTNKKNICVARKKEVWSCVPAMFYDTQRKKQVCFMKGKRLGLECNGFVGK